MWLGLRMPYLLEEQREVYESNDGYCYYCGKKLSWMNYGKNGRKGAWHIDHKRSRAYGGSDYLRNLVPACITCNLDKSVIHSRSYRKHFEPATMGGLIVQALGLPEGFLGASRRKRWN
jgi:5-methylcytosine-specific restriction endonuclease McrA